MFGWDYDIINVCLGFGGYMEEIEKIIKLDNRKIIYSVTEGYVPFIAIREGFLNGNDLEKNYSLCRWDDYGFEAYIKDKMDHDKVSFSFDINHPLYIPFLHLLGKDEELLIDDDLTIGSYNKYMAIYKKDNDIVLDFISKPEEKDCFEKFHIFIKNIGPDGRSKIDSLNLDTKIRLHRFFKEAEEVLLEEYHQITIEEWILKKDLKQNKVLKK